MSTSKTIKEKYDIEYVTKWKCPREGEDLRALISMPNVPKPCHLLNPRNLLGATTWNHMRKRAYSLADDTCEICGRKPENLRQRQGHEAYDIDYEKGTVKFVRVFCIDSLCHLFGIHTGRASSLHKAGNPLCPKEALIEGAENAFRLAYEYNQDHPDADLRLYSTWLDYLKQDDLKGPMEALIKKYSIRFYAENPKKMAKWQDWKLIIGEKEYPTPYKNEKEWKKAMEAQGEKDTARILQKNIEEKFSGGVYDELNEIINGSLADQLVEKLAKNTVDTHKKL